MEGNVTERMRKKAGRLPPILLFVLLQSCSCRQSDRPPGSCEAPPPTNVNAHALSPFHAGIGWEDRSGAAASHVVERRLEGRTWERRASLPPGTCYFLDLGLLPERRYLYRVGTVSDDVNVRFSGEVPIETGFSSMPRQTVTIHDPGLMQPGITIFSVEDPDYITAFAALVAVDDEGNYIWMLGDERFFVITDFDFIPGGTILAMSGSAMEQVTMSGERLWRFDELLLHHDIDVTPWGSVFGIIGYGDELEDGTLRSADALIEYDMEKHEKTGTWPLKEIVHPEDICIPCFYGEEYFFGHDWTHANAVAFDPDMQHIFLSVRNLNRIYNVSLSSGKVRWIMGDGGDFGEGLFAHQHDPQPLEPGRILLFDNGLHREGEENYSRVIEIEYDEEAGDARIVWEYREAPDFYNSIGGDANRLPNGNTLITDSMNWRIIEVSPDGQPVWELRLHYPYRIYKAVRLEQFPPS